jgi:hypothetical protein
MLHLVAEDDRDALCKKKNEIPVPTPCTNEILRINIWLDTINKLEIKIHGVRNGQTTDLQTLLDSSGKRPVRPL